jgi:hypothetical protein
MAVSSLGNTEGPFAADIAARRDRHFTDLRPAVLGSASLPADQENGDA